MNIFLKVSFLIGICKVANPCRNNGVCTSTTESSPSGNTTTVQCSCMPGFEGEYCEKVRFFLGCPPINPCLNEGVCMEKPFGFRCECKGNYTGNRCQYNLLKLSKVITTTATTTEDKVRKNRCLGGGLTCLNKGICIDTINGIKCQCLPQYSGSKCEIGIFTMKFFFVEKKIEFLFFLEFQLKNKIPVNQTSLASLSSSSSSSSSTMSNMTLNFTNEKYDKNL
jgi:hypothetical protein